ncbi:hypothetical protein BGW37DRAFT_246875 [Umbelopsis sp. PMI_123]|nr:hypothetical protein BGW37DRAFT_246875 [Umbelopsis sp. PMI_123]
MDEIAHSEESTIAEQIELVQENADQQMNAESDVANQQLALLQAIPELMDKLAQQPWQYDAHVQLIQALRQVDMAEELEATRQRMREIYPLTEAMWLEWIQDVKAISHDPENRERVKTLYLEAAEDYLSIPIWKSYVDYVIDNYKADTGLAVDEGNTEKEKTNDLSKEDRELLTMDTRNDLLMAIDSTRYHIAQSHEIWNGYIAFELELLNLDPSKDNVERVRSLYLERLKTIHMAWDQTFEGFSIFISTHDNANYENIMVTVNKECAPTKEAIGEREIMESELALKNNDLLTFFEYIKKEERAKSPTPLMQGLYERAVAVHCTDAGLWEDYLLFQMQQDESEVEKTISVAERSIRNCPWSGDLWTLYAGVFEQFLASNEQVFAVFQRALTNDLLLASYDDLIKTLLGKCDFERRQINWSSEDSRKLIQCIKDAYTLVAELFPKTNDPYYRLEQYEIFIETKVGNGVRARAIWEKVIKLHLNEVDVWIKFIANEMQRGNNIHYCQQQFRRAFTKELDYPERLMEAWTKFEHEYGTVSSFRDAKITMRRKTKLASIQWQQYQENEQVVQQPIATGPNTEDDQELMAKQLEKRQKERARKLRAKIKAKEKRRNENDQLEQTQEHEIKPTENRKRRRSSDQGGDIAQAHKQPKVEHHTDAHQGPENAETTMETSQAQENGQGKSTARLIPPSMLRRGGAARGGSRGRPKAGPARRLTVPKKTNKADAASEAPTTNEQSAPTEQKSNDDFRAMFLNK